jgi:hypothetical protein
LVAGNAPAAAVRDLLVVSFLFQGRWPVMIGLAFVGCPHCRLTASLWPVEIYFKKCFLLGKLLYFKILYK